MGVSSSLLQRAFVWQPSGRHRTRRQVQADPPALRSCVVALLVTVALTAHLCPPRHLGGHPVEAWSQLDVVGWDSDDNFLISSCRALVTALAGAQWSVGNLDSVTRILIDGSACMVEPCALFMPMRVQQQAHQRRVRGQRSRFLV